MNISFLRLNGFCGPSGLFTAMTGLLFLSLSPASAVNETNPPSTDKSAYHLFRPTPDDLMRELSTDRPDKTESPYTVDAGHFQVEMDLFSYTRDHDTAGGANTLTESFSAGPVNLKAGLFHNVDLQLVWETFTHERVKDRVTGTTAKQAGFGDLTTRLKVNLWGNDGGTTAFAVMPYLTLPTHQHDLGNDGLSGGLIFPLAVALPGEWSMGLMTEFDIARSASGSGSHAEFVNSITFGHAVYGPLSGYIEFFSLVSTERDARWVGTLDIGFTCELGKNVQLDAGVNLGVTRSADDVNPFLGLSFRL